MSKLSTKERVACTVLSNLKHDGKNFLDCRFNNLLCKMVEKTLRIDPIELIIKAVRLSEEEETVV